MDSGALLDILGNENRRRILRLLAHKPCYVTEISDYIGVSPKAVIDHLRRLESAGLVESRTDDQRRKYFNISRNLRLEVNVSPYGFGMKSAYPASTTLDITRCSHLTVQVETGLEEETGNPDALASELERLRALEGELSLAQRWVQGQIADTQNELADLLETEDDHRLLIDVLTTVAGGVETTEGVAEELEMPESVARDALESLGDEGILESTERGWTVADG